MSLSTFLNGTPVTKLRGLMFLALDDTAIIERRVNTGDSGGGANYTWLAAGTAPCRVYPVSIRGNPKLVGERIDERTTHFCVLPPETSVTPGERVSIAGRGTFEVTLALQRTDALTTVAEVLQLV